MIYNDGSMEERSMKRPLTNVPIERIVTHPLPPLGPFGSCSSLFTLGTISEI